MNYDEIFSNKLEVFNLKTAYFIVSSVEDNITAQGASASTAYALTKTNNFVTTINVSSDGVLLPDISNNLFDLAGLEITVWNLNSSNNLKVYTLSGQTIEGSNVDIVSANSKKCYIARNTGTYLIK